MQQNTCICIVSFIKLNATNMKHFHKQPLGLRMLENNLSQNQLAKYIQVSGGYLSDMMNGRRPFLMKWKSKIALVLDRTIDQKEWPQ